MRTSVFLKNYSKGVLLFVEEARRSEGARQTGRRRSAAARSRSASLHGRAPLTELRLVQVCGRSHIRWNRGPGGVAWALCKAAGHPAGSAASGHV